ncbi:MAG: hypothetical protein RBU45_14675 [Myxococcota bacterium]|jgi:hypothetical protein|nr:hypothetical protein [Myxococcota bacterium]
MRRSLFEGRLLARNLATSAGLMLLLAACSGPSPQPAGSADAGLPPVRLNLPTPPRIVKPAIPLIHPDGAISVYGLRQDSRAYFGKEIRVRATVVDVYVCPWAEEEAKEQEAAEKARRAARPVPPPKTTHPPCKEPYFFVADVVSARQKLLVVGYDPAELQPPEKGQAVLLTGRFANESAEGFMSPEGLLILTAWEPQVAADGAAPAVP